MNAREIHINDFGNFEIMLARFGCLELLWITSILGYNKFEIHSKQGKVFETSDPQIAVKKFNELRR